MFDFYQATLEALMVKAHREGALGELIWRLGVFEGGWVWGTSHPGGSDSLGATEGAA